MARKRIWSIIYARKTFIRRLRLLTIGNIISNGCDPETGVFPGKFVEVDVPLGYRQPLALYRKFGNIYTAKIK